MRIAVNTRLLLPNKLEGIGWFCYETMKRITKEHPEHEFIFIFDRPYSNEFVFSENIIAKIVRPVTRHPILWYLWFEWALPRKLRKWKVDLFVSPDGFVSLRSKVPSIAVIHDLNFVHRPHDLPFLTRKFYNYFYPRYARKAKSIGTVSEYSARDITNTFGVEASKIDVFHNGVNEIYAPIGSDQIDYTRKQFSEGLPYFIYIGSLHPRKNIVNMLKAYEQFRRNSGLYIKMVFVGEKMFLTKSIDDCLSSMEFRNDVIFAGRRKPEELHYITASALAMVFVPFFEGFGIPVLEAMKCDVPVITSNVTSLPEVGGDAVLYCDPDNVNDIAEAMITISGDEQIRSDLIRKSRERVKKFSWDITAEKFWNLIESTLNEPKSFS